jgi:hypothetical protein
MRASAALASIPETKFMDARSSSAAVGPYRLHAILLLAFALFAGFIYLFNFTSFF